MIRQLVQVQDIPASLDAVWAYFATPANLNDMTPPELFFRTVTGETPVMQVGQLIEYRVRFAPCLWSTWLTEIRHMQDHRFFVDEQRLGPYRLWYHEHHFETIANGVRMTDRVTYDVGCGWLGDMLHRLWIGAKLRRIFAYRKQRVAELFQ